VLTSLSILNIQIDELEARRDILIRELRSECKHLNLVELDASPPQRICADCGAEERGWYCGYHVLVMQGDSHTAPHKDKRALVLRTTDPALFYAHRKGVGRYLVGQSHPAFGGGIQTYEQLTEQ
jgi:hypothetical protein